MIGSATDYSPFLVGIVVAVVSAGCSTAFWLVKFFHWLFS